MKLDKLSRLLSAFNQVAPQTQSAQLEQDQTAAEAGSVNSEAVRLADKFGNTTLETSPEDRRVKVDRIAAQVKSGNYRSDSREVAKAIIRDLLV